jgi:hypothetical protein
MAGKPLAAKWKVIPSNVTLWLFNIAMENYNF